MGSKKFQEDGKNNSYLEFLKHNESSGLLSKSTVRRGGTYDFEEELKRLKTIHNIEK